MDTTEIQARIDVMPARMSEKGKRLPEASFWLQSNKNLLLLLGWAKDGDRWASSAEFLRADNPAELLDKADAYIEALPSIEEERMKEFTNLLAKTIELGRAHGIEVDFVNPLIETMKRLSENVLVHHK